MDWLSGTSRGLLLLFILNASACFKDAIECERGDTGSCIDLADSASPETTIGPSAPTGLTASRDRANDVELQWDAVVAATSYRVFRCDLDCSSSSKSWAELDIDSLTSQPRFIDADVAAPATPSAPARLTASGVEPDAVYLQWDPVVSPPAPRYHYRVVAASERGESAPSAIVEGHRAERPVTGYELAFDGGSWATAPGGLVTELVDADAGPPTLEAGTVTASQGVHATHVSLSLVGARAVPGVERVYRVRATTDYGPGAPSPNVAGRRMAGALEVA